MTNQILDGYNGYAIEAEKKILQLECKVMEFVALNQKLELENALLKQHIEDHVTDANNQTREIVRLRVIIERAKEWTKNSFNETKLIEILNEAGKGEGNLRRDGG